MTNEILTLALKYFYFKIGFLVFLQLFLLIRNFSHYFDYSHQIQISTKIEI